MGGRWVRINGRINHFGGRCSINVFNVIPITDFNEITHHFLEVIYAHLVNTQPPKQNNNNGNGMGGGGGPQTLKQKVMAIIGRPQWTQSETGCNVETIFNALTNEDVNEIRTAIDDLSNEGMIYSTLDDDHYKSSSG